MCDKKTFIFQNTFYSITIGKTRPIDETRPFFETRHFDKPKPDQLMRAKNQTRIVVKTKAIDMTRPINKTN